MTLRVIAGDCREALRTLSDASVHAVVTDPPYELGFMGRAWDRQGVATDPDTWSAVLRVMKPGAHLVAFGGTRTFHRMAVAIEDAGFEIRDTLMWLYGTGFPKSHDVSKGIDKAAGAVREVVGQRGKHHDGHTRTGGLDCRLFDGGIRDIGDNVPITAPATPEAAQWAGWGTALKPAWEPICLARKPLDSGTVAANVLAHGTGAINVDACRINVTGQRPDDTMPEWANDHHLCSSCAEHADSAKRHGTPAIRASTATRHAAPTTSARDVMLPLDTSRLDTGCSDGTSAADTLISLSTGASGKMQTDQSQQPTTSTTSTATNSTTHSRTCVACGDTITAKNTPSTRQRPSDGPQMQRALDATAPKGRWPSNLLHDGSDEVEAAFAAFGEKTTHGNCEWEHKKPKFSGIYQPMPGGTKAANPTNSGAASRFFYSAKATAADRANSRHPTVKPVALMRWLCRLITPPGGTILDPFAGSGTTGEAAMLEGFDAILIERETAAHIDHRVDRWSGADLPLFVA
jgi:hypothetical protein